MHKIDRDHKEAKEPIGDRPEYWDRYGWGGQEAWEQWQVEKRHNADRANQAIAEAFLETTDWAGLKPATLEQLRNNMPTLQEGSASWDFMRKALQAGLKLSPFKHGQYPITMAMKCLLKVTQMGGASFWIQNDIIDPPGETAGFISLLVASCKRYSYSDSHMADLARQAIAHGASLERPTLKMFDQSSDLFNEPQLENPGSDSLITLMGQARAHAGFALCQVFSQAAKNPLEQAETVLSCMQKLSEDTWEWRRSGKRKDEIERKQDEICLMLSSDTTNLCEQGTKTNPQLGRIKSKIAVHALMTIGSEAPQSRFPAVARIIENTISHFPETNTTSTQRTLESSLKQVLQHFSFEDAIKWINQVLQTGCREIVARKMMEILAREICGASWIADSVTEIDRGLKLMNWLGQYANLGDPEASKSISDHLMGECMLPAWVARYVCDQFRDHQWRPGTDAWTTLVKRLDPKDDTENGYRSDRSDTIEALGGFLVDFGAIPGPDDFGSLARPIELQRAARAGQYSAKGEWGPIEIQKCRISLLTLMTKTVVNRIPESDERANTPFRAIAREAEKSWKNIGDCTMQIQMANIMMDAGIAPDIGCLDLADNSPFRGVIAEHERKQMEATVASAPRKHRISGRL